MLITFKIKVNFLKYIQLGTVCVMQFNKKQVKISADEQVNLFSKQLNMVH